jgi:hypothetical protein
LLVPLSPNLRQQIEETMKQLVIASVLVTATAFGVAAQTADKSGMDPAAATKRMDAATPTMKSDPTGKTSLGVDISNAGSYKASQQRFVQSLPSEQEGKVRRVCVVAVGHPDQHAAEVVHFCENITQ